MPGQQPPADSRAADPNGGGFVNRWLQDDLLTAVQNLKPIAADCGLSMAQLAVAWVLQNPAISAAIIGASRPEQVVENVAAAGVKLPDDVLAAIDAALDGFIERDASKTVSPAERP